jgi:type IV pilus assembly protein PilC
MPKKRREEKIFKLPRLFFKKRVFYFINNLGELLSAGLTISASLDGILEETTSLKMRKVIIGIKEDIQEGDSLSYSLKKRRVLPDHVVSFIELGEKSGNLVKNINILIEQNEKEIVFKSKINSSLLYAVIVIFLTVAVSVGIAWFVLPQIAEIYSQFNFPLPWITRLIIGLGNILAKYGFILVPLFISFALIIFYFLFSFPKTRFVGHLILFKLPLVNRLIKEVEISRMGYTMNSMISAGIPLSESLKSLPYTTTFKNYQRFYFYLSKKIEEGSSFQQAISSYKKVGKLIPANVRQMIVAAEKSGTLSNTFLRIGMIYETRVEATSRNLPIVIEPILLIIIGIGAAGFILGTMIPIYDLFKVIK